MVGAACGVVALSLWVLGGKLLREPPKSLPDLLGAVVVLMILLSVTAVCSIGVYIMLRAIRFAWMLDGTWLGMRYVLRTAWVDLATAEITTEHHQRSRQQRLVARSPRTGDTIRLTVTGDQGLDGTLPAESLTELADAIIRDRVRSGEQDRAFVIADRLRQLSVDSATNVHVPEPGSHDGEQREPAFGGDVPISPEVHTARFVWMRAFQFAGVLVVLLGGLIGLGYLLGFEGVAVRIAIAIALITVLLWPGAVREARRKQLRQARASGEPTDGAPG